MPNYLTYPEDIESNPEYGGMFVAFKPKKYGDTQTTPNKEKSASSIPQNAVSGSRVDTQQTNLQVGASVPQFNIKDPVGFAPFKNLGGLTKLNETLDDYIILYVPENAGTSYKANWEDENFPIAGHAAEGASEAISGIRSASSASDLGAAALKVGAAIGNAGAALAMQTLAGLPGANEFMRRAGVAPNPKKQMIFKDMEFRQFQFSYTFFAKSESEYDKILQILHKFKQAMHPEVGGIGGVGSYLYNYPDEFEIEYRVGEKRNVFMHKFKRCALIGMDVKYAPQGLFVTHSDGSPTVIQMVLQFRELDVLTKKDFQLDPEKANPLIDYKETH